MKHIYAVVFLLCYTSFAYSQDTTALDSVQTLREVVVRAYENNGRLIDVPAAVSVVNQAQLTRFNNINILPALNVQPGIRMEERSPGSYRLNIRGSSLRSPFGVRNVKVYYNGIPYTDPGGGTFLNQLGFYNVHSLEVIKGPGSSLYGAGTGGVILINSDASRFRQGVNVDHIRGSYGLAMSNVGLRIGNNDFHQSLNYQNVKSDGYREHTEIDRKVFTWDASARVNQNGRFNAHFFYGDLFYETPGALTKAEYVANPRAARPPAGPNPGSVQARAAIYQKMFMAGFSYNHRFNEFWQNETSLYGSYSRLTNPTIRNYEQRTEPHTGGRTTFTFNGRLNNTKIRWVSGAEIQQGFGAVRVYRNVGGERDTLQTEDEINNRQAFVFTQLGLEFPGGWSLTAGASLNQLKVEFNRVSSVPSMLQSRKYNNELAPRIALLKKLNEKISVYGSVSRGFSPPTNAEILPSTGIIDTRLEAEYGINYEVGSRGSFMRDRVYFDVNAFYFRLNNTISQRRDAGGADFFVNAGATKQMGVETMVGYRLQNDPLAIVTSMDIRINHTLHDFTYDEYIKVTNDTANLSGKRLPSIPKHYLSATFDVNTALGFYTNLTYSYSDPVPLNDANTEFASSYNLLSARLGWKKRFNDRYSIDLFATGDNLFDVDYSLGNDINAFGGRYYNAAAGGNLSVGVSLGLLF
jgi:iron complex outermembrane recepter protein